MRLLCILSEYSSSWSLVRTAACSHFSRRACLRSCSACLPPRWLKLGKLKMGKLKMDKVKMGKLIEDACSSY